MIPNCLGMAVIMAIYYGYYNSHNEVSKGGADCDSI